MKIIKIILLIISIVLTIQRSETGNLISSKTKWKDKYDCEILVNENKKGAGSFTPNSLTNPQNEEKLGWVFTMKDGPSDILKTIMVQVGNTNKWYFPYRGWSNDLHFTSPFYDNKFIQGTFVSDDSKTSYSIKVKLPFKLVGSYINDDEGQQVCNWIKDFKGKSQTNIQTAKVNLINAGNNYVNHKTLYDAAVKGDKALKEAIKNLDNEIATLNSNIKADQEIFYKNIAEIPKLEKIITTKTNALNELQNKIKAKTNLMDSSKSTLKTLNKKETEKQTATLQAKVGQDTNQLNLSINALKTIAPSSKVLIESANTAALNGNLQELIKNINNIYA